MSQLEIRVLLRRATICIPLYDLCDTQVHAKLLVKFEQREIISSAFGNIMRQLVGAVNDKAFLCRQNFFLKEVACMGVTDAFCEAPI